MSDSAPIVDCHECKDLAFARNLARQMKEGYGRHNSNLTFRPGGVLRPILHIRENQQARVIGRIGDRALRERWQDCEVGDAVPEASFNLPRISEHRTIVVQLPTTPPFFYDEVPMLTAETPPSCERRIFERVHFYATHDDGRTWADTYIWKRLS